MLINVSVDAEWMDIPQRNGRWLKKKKRKVEIVHGF
jgi:hypothetical protein